MGGSRHSERATGEKPSAFVVSLLLIGFVISGFLFLLGDDGAGMERSHSSAYTTHAVISINGDADFASQASSEGWPGNGNAGNPYVIANYQINGLAFQTCIVVGNTSVHFVIRDCLLENGYGAGVLLYNVDNGDLRNNTCSGNSPWGVRLDYSTGNQILNNTCSSNIGLSGVDSAGIYVRQSIGNSILNNTCDSNYGDGICLYLSASNNVSGNHCANSLNYGRSTHGIHLIASADCIVRENICQTNDVNGIFLYGSDRAAVARNSLYEDFIYLESSDLNTVSRNTLVNGTISLFGSVENTIDNNTCFPGSVGISLSGSEVLGGSTDNLIADNNCSRCYDGISIGPSFIGVGTDNVSGANRIVRNDLSNCTDKSIYIGYSDGNLVSENNCSGSPIGMRLYKSDYSRFERNDLYGNTLVSISLEESLYDIFRSNTVHASGFRIVGQTAPVWALHDIDSSNKVNDKPVYYAKGMIGGSVPVGYGQIIIAASLNVSLSDLVVDDSCIGISIGFSSGITIERSSLSSNSMCGIQLYHSDNCTIKQNSCSMNDDGIRIETGSVYNRVELNNCSDNSGDGIDLSSAALLTHECNLLINNTCGNNTGNGIRIYHSSYNTVAYNTLWGNSEFGIMLTESSTIALPMQKFTTHNLLYGNLLMDNGEAGQAWDGGQDNLWNISGYGNYWSNWQTPDSDGDGIVDVPYAVPGDARSIDHYPLTVAPPQPIPEFPSLSVIVVTGLLCFLVLCIRRHARSL